MIGAIAGDIIGSRFEGSKAREADFTLFHPSCRFTDDTVCTLAVANALLGDRDFARHLRALGRIYPNAGYGGMFRRWMRSDDAPLYGSWGNGAPMRVSAVGWLATTIEEVDQLAEAQAAVSHNHPDAIDASRAVARSIFLLSRGEPASSLKTRLEQDFNYDLGRKAMAARPKFDISAKGTAQTAITIALMAESFEDTIRQSALLGGDTDTLACISGAIAEAIHGVPEDLANEARQRLSPDLLNIVERFDTVIGSHGASAPN